MTVRIWTFSKNKIKVSHCHTRKMKEFREGGVMREEKEERGHGH